MTVKNYRDLIVWHKAMELVEEVYRETRCLPNEEMYGLRMQLRKAAVSVPSNISEGQGRRSKGEFLHYLSIAHGSVREAETQILISDRLGYLTKEAVFHLMEKASEVGRLITGLSKSVAMQ
ncbi:MAG TPA: four helix bundle protein [Acidobacteriota bacterium]|nr:four helix bundle protein [Acidobacteriota bacterium]